MTATVVSDIPVTQIYKRTEIIGRGKFGVVYKGIHRATNQVVAIKVLNLDTAEDEVKDVQQEIQFLAQLKGVPNVTHYHGSFLNNTRLWIVMDHCAGGSMRTLLRPGPVEERYIGVIVRELLTALQAVHKAGVIHRDLKAANVLITNEGRVELCDFGVAAQLTSTALKRSTMAGTPYWMAPEVIMDGQMYNVKADIWSLGITIYEFATGNPPYSDKDAMRAMQLITSHEPPRLEGRNHSPILKEIIALCLDESPDSRPMAEDLLKSKFVRTYRPQPSSILKELISRYLLWREKKSSRDSIGAGLEDDLDNSIANVEEAGDLDVKWDFDSLSSAEYILDNDININNINDFSTNNDMSPVHATNARHNYDDFMTNQYQQTYVTQIGTGIGSTVREDPTLRAGTTIQTSRKEAPKSLLQLFEENGEEDEESDHELNIASKPLAFDSSKIINTASASHSTAHNASPMVEIEIPSMDELSLATPLSTATETGPRTASRPRASTLQQQSDSRTVHSSASVSYLDLRNLNKQDGTSDFAVNLQRRPTLPSTTMQSHPTSQPPHNHRRTPSPTKQLHSHFEGTTSSPPKHGTTPPHSMKPLMTSTASMPPLLQPMNSTKTVAESSQSLGLRIQTPLARAPPNLGALDNAMKTDDLNINQFGVNPNLMLGAPKVMTPLTERQNVFSGPATPEQRNGSISTSPPLQQGPPRTHTSTLSMQRQQLGQTGQQQQIRKPSTASDEYPHHPTSRSSSISGSTAASITTAQTAATSVGSAPTIESKILSVGNSLFPLSQTLNPALFLDNNPGSSRQHLTDEISGLLSKIGTVLELMEEELSLLNE
ncbi:unnamed protein product [Kuraishia capsulata CBS 1993]|uniref:non-specific serine/threonine protein kinase n=1 Tax=Kuraishia capsulata CBS 1993 TaxID=1382522 RepID=W6MQS5_9ASCO|nr:uncharacterized protein KUCA_T00000200001 [Kuraishia capsulata CBS 1993]CDK24240.1 unnamed protein product [Kuraishia capsulata CBS 1993]